MTKQLEEATIKDDKIEDIKDDNTNQEAAETTSDNEQSLEEKSEIKDRAEIEDNVDTKSETEINTENKTTNNSAINIDFSSINYKDFEKIDQEQIDLYYMLNDNKNNSEFLNEDLVALSKREEEIKALKEKEKEEFDFKMEELVADENEIKVDLTGIIDDLEIEKK